METISVKQPINLKVVKFELDFTQFFEEKPKPIKKRKEIRIPKIKTRKRSIVPPPPSVNVSNPKRDVKDLVEELLEELYSDRRDWSHNSTSNFCRGSTTAASLASSQSIYRERTDSIEISYLETLDINSLKNERAEWENRLRISGERLAKYVRVRDRLRRQQKKLCTAFTVLLQHITGDANVRFGLTPGEGEGPGEGGYAEWLHAMRLVARLPAGVPHHFRRKLWLTLAERHLTARAIDWPVAERACFRGTAQPDDTELGAQILKDLHRTGCSLFCGTEGRENQAMLRRVLLAYARWNKDVGYCQGFNMLAAIILEVMEKSESDSLKVMIYLVEAVLPEGYFADDLRGLSADMAAFRDLLRLRLPRLANHMDHLQRISDGKKGLNSVPSLLVGWFVHDETLTRLQMWREQTSSYHCLPIWLGTDFEPISGGVEPPLPDVFTMQWFLTLYATWIPRESLLKIWDLVLLDGNEILLLTALAIWDMLQDRILSTRSADEFYSCMGSGVGVVFQAGEALVARVVALGSEPELPRLRSKHRYRVAPPAPPAAVYQPPLHSAVQSMTKRGLRLFYSEDEGDSSDDGNKMALATVIPRREERMGAGDRLSLDIGALKRQYARLRERQRQAHVILAAACARHHAAVGVSTSPTSLTVNNLLLGKSAIVSSRGRRLGPPPGAIPPSRQTSSTHEKTDSRQRGCTDETISWNEERYKKNLDRKNSLKWKDIKKDKVLGRKASIDLDETGDGIIVSEHEANEMIASLRSRSSSETSSYSSHTVASSTDTSLCDDNERASDSEPDLPLDVDNNKLAPSKKKIVVTSPLLKETIIKPPAIEEARILHSPIEDRVFHSVKSIQDISEYLDSAAGEPLRTYIDGFETKLKDSVINISSESDNYKRKSPFKSISPFVAEIKPESNEVFQRLSRPEYQVTSRSSESIKSKNSSKLTTNFTELSPLDISPRHFGITRKSPCEYYHKPIIKSKCPSSSQSSTRPPDIIDSLTMYPNFVPDIDLSEKNISDFESPLRSPDAESVVISEDEPPILLKIDKYFEHSPEFFGARVTDPNNTDIPNRRATKRQSRIPKKPDSLTLKINNNEKLLNIEAERASSLPQSHSFTEIKYFSSDNDNSEEEEEEASKSIQFGTEETEKIGHNIWEKTETVECKASEITSSSAEQKFSPKNSFLDYGRKNSERALQIIQENSQILNRILTKQNVTDNNATAKVVPELNKSGNQINLSSSMPPEKSIRGIKSIDSPLMKESTSDSRIGLRKKSFNNGTEKNDYIRVRPISIDDPFSLEVRNFIARNEELTLKNVKSPSSECLGNKTDLYGWENKGFFAKCEYKTPKVNNDFTLNSNKKSESVQTADTSHKALTTKTTCDWSQSFLIDSKTSVALLPTEIKDTSSYECKYISDDYKYPLSNRYNDFVLSKVSDICSKPVGQGPKVIENPSKVEDHTSDFTHAVTSSISFTYEHSLEEDSPIGAKSNSSDTLCQIASLDQISTPISPKTFPNRETPTLPKDADKTDPMVAKLESDDTCSAITSLLETDTLSSLSYPRSPSTGSYHHFPTRPAMRMPKELAVRLGMYPKDTISSPPK